MVAARTDKSLKRVVADTDASSLTAMRALGTESRNISGTSDNKNTSQVEDIVELTVYLLRGLVLQEGVHENLSEKRRLFEIWKQLVIDVS